MIKEEGRLKSCSVREICMPVIKRILLSCTTPLRSRFRHNTLYCSVPLKKGGGGPTFNYHFPNLIISNVTQHGAPLNKI